MDHCALIAAARGDVPVSVLFENARLVNVYSGEIEKRSIAVAEGFVAGFGDYPALERVDLAGRFVFPGFIDAHVHVESSMACVSEFVRAVLPRGTTSVVADPHEIANVLGRDGIAYMIREGGRQPMQFFFTLPSCVPATDMETSGAALDASALSPLMVEPVVPALGEMMNYPGVINCDAGVLEKIRLAESAGKRVDGHAPGLSGKALNAYVAAGIRSDHECVALSEAREKLCLGMHIMIREGSGAKNLDDLLPLVTPENAGRAMWCTDDRHPHDIINEGHIDALVRRAIAWGLPPVTAIRMASLHPAGYFRLPRLGALAPGMRADMVVTEDLETLPVDQVYAGGRLVAENGRLRPELELPAPASCPSPMRVDAGALDFRLPAKGGRAQVIGVVPGQIVTRRESAAVTERGGFVECDTSADILKIAVIERYRGSGRMGLGLIKGFGLKRGAIASSVAHDSHNIVVVGAEDPDMRAAVSRIVEMGGGLCAASGGSVQAELPLPLAGLMSELPLEAVRQALDRLHAASRKFGCRLDDPFMTLSFMALPVIPELKMTDRGLFDVSRFAHAPLFP